ncbi:MAG: hypothetical protein ACXU89_26760, partial [Xanthobacteraceae bacterium]
SPKMACASAATACRAFGTTGAGNKEIPSRFEVNLKGGAVILLGTTQEVPDLRRDLSSAGSFGLSATGPAHFIACEKSSRTKNFGAMARELHFNGE